MSTSATDFEGVVILGVPRSGTTLLSKLISAHPEIHCAVETQLLRAASRFLMEEPFSEGLSIGVRSSLAFFGMAEDRIVDSLREMCFGIHRELRDDAEKSLVVGGAGEPHDRDAPEPRGDNGRRQQPYG